MTANECSKFWRVTPQPPSSSLLKLARRFVSDEPPAALVGRVADVFKKTDGDITAMLRAIFNSPEFRLSGGVSGKSEDSV